MSETGITMDAEGQKEPQDQRRASAPGAQLATQREAMGLTVEQIADQLKLAPRQVIALEQGDYASLPNMAVTRGFIRAYAKVVRLDPAPLVAQIEVAPAVPVPEHAPVKRDKMPTSFSESRFPTLTERRSSKPTGWIVGGVVVVLAVAAAAGAWQAGLIPADLLQPKQAAVETVPPAAGTTTEPLQAPNVPLVSPPPSPDNTAPLVTAPATETVTAPDTAAATPVPAAAAPAATPAVAPVVTPAPAAVPPAAPAAGANPLVLTVTEDSWIEIRRPGAPSLVARLVKAGSTETFDIDRQSTLIVGKPDGVRATLRGEPVPLPKVANGTISRVQIK